MFFKFKHLRPKHLCIALALASPLLAIDGIAISYRSSYTSPYGHQAGYIQRHIIKNDSLISSSTLLDDSTARCVCISPSGRHIAFIRTSDGTICTTSINASHGIGVIGEIGAQAWIDWAKSDRIHFTKYWGYISIRKLILATGETSAVASFLQGIQQFSMAALTESLTCGTAVLQLGNGAYDVAQFNYKGWKLPNREFVNPGCGTHVSPNGQYFSLNACNDTAAHNKVLTIWDWERTSHDSLTCPGDEYWARARWAVNNNEWLISTIGKGKELLDYHDAMLHTKDLTTTIRLSQNASGAFNEGCDFWVGDPDSVIDTTSIAAATMVRSANLATIAINQVSTNTLMMSVPGWDNYTIVIYALDGKAIHPQSVASNTHFAFSNLAPGSYIAYAASAEGKKIPHRFIISKR